MVELMILEVKLNEFSAFEGLNPTLHFTIKVWSLNANVNLNALRIVKHSQRQITNLL